MKSTALKKEGRSPRIAIRFTAAVFIIPLLMSACELDINLSNDNDKKQETITTDTDFTEQEPMPFPIEIAGTEIDKSPESVVCLSPALTEIIYELGFGGRLKGRGSYCDYPPAVAEKTDMGSSANPDISRIVAMKPDIVLTQTPIADKDLFIMEQAGIKTLVLPSPKSLKEFNGIYQAVGLLFNGAFTGKESGDEAFSPVSKACNNSGVIYMGNYIYITENLSVATLDTLESAVLSCFGNNIAKSGAEYDFDTTALLENQPEIILLSDKYSVSDLMGDEVFSQLYAVLNEKIIYINNMYFERPTNRIVGMLEEFSADFKKLSQ